MKRTFLAVAACGIMMIPITKTVHATLISPTDVIYNSLGELSASFSTANLINHSGLVTDFTSGATELPSYLLNNTYHIPSPSYAQSGFASANNYISSGYLDFDLGESYTLNSFLLWNDNDYQGINNFELFVDNESTFSNSVSLGTYSATYGPSGYNAGVPLQLFNLNPASGRYIRLQIFDTHNIKSNLVNFGEIAFDAKAAPIPEPAAMPLLVLGMIGMISVSTRKNRK